MPRSTSSSRSSVALVAARYELVRELRVDGDTVDWEAFDTALDRRVVVQLLRPELAHDTPGTEGFGKVARGGAGGRATGGVGLLNAGTDPDPGQGFVVREWPAAAPSATPAARKPADIAQLLSRFDGSP